MDTMDPIPGAHGESSDEDTPQAAAHEKQCHTKEVQQFLKERSADIRQSKQPSQQSKQSSQQSSKPSQPSLPGKRHSQENSDLKVALMRRISDKEEGDSADGLGSKEPSWPVPNPYAQAIPEVVNPFKGGPSTKQASPKEGLERVPGTAVHFQNGLRKAVPSKGWQLCLWLSYQLPFCPAISVT